MLSNALAQALNEPKPDFVETASVAGCGGGCDAEPPTFPPGKGGYPAVPMIGPGSMGYRGKIEPANSGDTFTPPCKPYEDYHADARNMTIVVGEATIPAGATTEVQIQPTQGRFAGYYVEIYAVDAANPQSRQRVRVGRFSVGDCPGDCRTITVFSDVFEANQACCNGRPLRSTFGRVNDGQELRVDINNPNTAGDVLVQVVVRGYCHRGTCAC